MRNLEFIGIVRSNSGQFSQDLVFPGRDDLIVAPEDWPMQLAPGTLNIQIDDDGFPQGHEEFGKSNGLKALDEGKFRAALVIPQRLIAGNPVKPDPDRPTSGFAQVWRAELQVIATSQAATCWMFRIIDSDMLPQIELVAQEHLQSRLNLSDGMAVKVTVWEQESNWKPKTPHEIIAEWCEATRGVEQSFGTKKAMGYLIGEKFLNFLEVAETDREWRQAIPDFVAEIKAMFERKQLSKFLNTPRRLGPLGHTATDKVHRKLREALDEEEKAREDARNLMLLEWAKELLLEDAEG
jgi:hypothetical protein